MPCEVENDLSDVTLLLLCHLFFSFVGGKCSRKKAIASQMSLFLSTHTSACLVLFRLFFVTPTKTEKDKPTVIDRNVAEGSRTRRIGTAEDVPVICASLTRIDVLRGKDPRNTRHPSLPTL